MGPIVPCMYVLFVCPQNLRVMIVVDAILHIQKIPRRMWMIGEPTHHIRHNQNHVDDK